MVVIASNSANAEENSQLAEMRRLLTEVKDSFDIAGNSATVEENSQLAEMRRLLTEVKDSVDEIRAQLTGTNKPFHSVAEFAEMARRAPYTVRRWIKEGRITATRVSGTGPKGKLLIAHDQLERVLI